MLERRKGGALGGVHTEITPAQEHVQIGSPRDLATANLQIEVEKLLEDSEAILRTFVAAPLSDYSGLTGWQLRLQMNIRNRLAGSPDKRYLVGLSQAARGMNEEKAKIVTAAYLYELDHRDEMRNIPNYNSAVLLRLTLGFSKTRDDLLGVAMKHYLDAVPLEEIYKNFGDAKNLTPQDLPGLAALALERFSKESDAARKVLENAKADLFRPAVNTKRKTLRAEGFFQRVGGYSFNAERYSSEGLDHLLTSVKEQDPNIFDEVVKIIDVELERVTRKEIPLDSDEFLTRLNKSQYHEWESLRRDHGKLVFLHSMIQTVPVLRAAHDEIVENRRIEKAQKAREEEERQHQLELEREQEKVRGEEERRGVAVEQAQRYQEEQARRMEQGEVEVGRLVDRLSRIRVEASLIDKQIDLQVEDVEIAYLGDLLPPHSWVVLRSGDEATPQSIAFLEEQVNGALYDLYIDDEKVRSVHEVLAVRMKELESSIASVLLENKEKLFAAVDIRLSYKEHDLTIHDYEVFLGNLESGIEHVRRVRGSVGNKDTRQLIDDILDIAERKFAEAVLVSERLRAEVEEHEKRESMASAQEEYLRAQVERQTDYLREIYSIGTGLGLEYVESRATREAGAVVGSVFFGQGLRMKQTFKPELRLELMAERGNISLEMGEDLESVKKRTAMVNWVAPHEIAHLVEAASDMHTRLFSEKELAPVRGIVKNWKGGNQELAGEAMSSIVNEITIDAVGYRMLKEHGSANPFDQTQAERIAAALRGYVAMMDVLEHVLHTRAEDEEMRSLYSAILLREIAAGETIVEDARANGVDERTVTETEHEIEKLRIVFKSFNQETRFIDDGQVEDVIEMCKGYFEKAGKVPLVRRSRE